MVKYTSRMSVIEKKHGILAGIILCILLAVVAIYFINLNRMHPKTPLFSQAEELYTQKYYDEALEKYKEYLEETKDSSNKKRWEAWQRLLYIRVQLKNDFAQGIEILQAMEKEYSHDTEKMPLILKDLMHVYYMQGAKDNVIKTVEKILTSKFDLSSKEKIELYRYYAMLIADDVKNLDRGEGQFSLCIENEKKDTAVQQWCKYELGVIYTLDMKYTQAKNLFAELIAKNGDTEEINYFSRYMLGTIYVSMGEKTKAMGEFKSIENLYPNKQAIQSRIKALQKVQKVD